MPPRNSLTKPFKPYQGSGNGLSIPIEKIYSMILTPEKAINNTWNQEFTKYKKSKAADGIDLEEELQRCIKDDMDGDTRYIHCDWYQRKLRG